MQVFILDKVLHLCYNKYMKENRTTFIIVRVTEHEKELFEQDCKSQDKTKSELAREKLGFDNQ